MQANKTLFLDQIDVFFNCQSQTFKFRNEHLERVTFNKISVFLEICLSWRKKKIGSEFVETPGKY